MLRFNLHKMHTEYRKNQPVQYFMSSSTQQLVINDFLGQRLNLKATGIIYCLACGQKTPKSYNQGYCFPCMRTLARCDSCIIRPELCHYHRGTCREPEWGQKHCLIPHVIYLANSSGIKVGITRSHQAMTRWIDQGAIQAIAIAEVNNRLDSGVIECILKQNYPDKTNWRAMLLGKITELDMLILRDEAVELLPLHPFSVIQESEPLAIQYPVLHYPKKITSLSFEKNALIEGILLGIKGQYLIFDTGVINIRNFSGYEIDWQL